MKRVLFTLLLILSCYPFLFAGQLGELKVAFLDVGQGDSILILSPSGKPLLIDGGNAGQEETIFKWLKKFGINDRIEIVILTHPVEDSVGGLIKVIDKYDVGNIFDPGMSFSTYLYERFLELIMTKQDELGASDAMESKLADVLAQKMHYEFYNPHAGDILSWDPDVELVVLSPNRLFHNTSSDANNNSLVIKLVYNNISFLFTGGIETEAEKYLAGQGSKINATFLKVPHHGAGTSCNPFFLNMVKPKESIIMVGANNKYGYPSSQTLERLQKIGSKIYRTDLNGTILVTTDGIKYTITPEKKTEETEIVSQIYTPTSEKEDSGNEFITEKKVNINKANVDELVSIPGLGAFKAQMIIKYRDKNGPFATLEDLEKVPGFNKTIVEKFKDKITL